MIVHICMVTYIYTHIYKKQYRDVETWWVGRSLWLQDSFMPFKYKVQAVICCKSWQKFERDLRIVSVTEILRWIKVYRSALLCGMCWLLIYFSFIFARLFLDTRSYELNVFHESLFLPLCWCSLCLQASHLIATFISLSAVLVHSLLFSCGISGQERARPKKQHIRQAVKPWKEQLYNRPVLISHLWLAPHCGCGGKTLHPNSATFTHVLAKCGFQTQRAGLAAWHSAGVMRLDWS